jgi:hypothetical protein
MSRDTYQVEFNDGKVRINQILAALAEIAGEMDLSHKRLMSELKWASENAINTPEFKETAPIFETEVPDELTRDLGVSNEVLRIQPISDRIVQVAITDASLPPERCEEIAIRFAQQLYRKITGKDIERWRITVRRIASLEANICEHCLKPLEGLPYRCRNCGRTFCYEHRRPETHGCQLNEKTSPQESSLLKHVEAEKCEGNVRPEVVVRRIPCG